MRELRIINPITQNREQSLGQKGDYKPIAITIEKTPGLR